MREMGVRMALGARGSDLVRLVVGEGIKVTLLGAAVGLVGAVLVSRALSAWLFAVSPTDPWTYGAITALLVVVAVLACYLPARRAASSDPTAMLNRS